MYICSSLDLSMVNGNKICHSALNSYLVCDTGQSAYIVKDSACLKNIPEWLTNTEPLAFLLLSSALWYKNSSWLGECMEISTQLSFGERFT